MRWFVATLQPGPDEHILDVGGYPATWTPFPQIVARIDCVNLHPVDFPAENFPRHRINTGVEDGCSLTFEDQSYEILFSNSVIEHVGDWEAQKKFAAETRRVGRKLWIQTPAYECPLEPHFLAPFVHWFPVQLRKPIVRWCSPWAWMTRPDARTVETTIAFTRLLTKKKFQELYPDCQIITERLCGIFPKSYIACRSSAASVSTSRSPDC